jgi:flagellar hook-basal body complex protein FliE
MEKTAGIANPHAQQVNNASPSNDNKATSQCNFVEQLESAVSQVDKLQENADKLSQELAVGSQVPLHETMIALEKADISLRLLIHVRDKVLEAYREVMHMQF